MIVVIYIFLNCIALFFIKLLLTLLIFGKIFEFNPKQMLILFCHEESSYFHTKPTHFQEYKIQRTDLQTAEFKIHLSEKTKLKKIKEIFIQLKITDAGIQQRPEFKIQ